MEYFFLLLMPSLCLSLLLNTEEIEERIRNIANSGLGVSHMQNVLNNEVTYTEESFNGDALVLQLRDALSEKFSSRFDLVRNLKNTVEQTYDNFYVIPPHEECCHTAPSTELDTRFKNYVHHDTMCMRVSDFAEGSLKYATEDLLSTFKENMRSVPGVKYQYFGTEQGVLFSFPAAPAVDCSWYDPRFRPWYVVTATPFPKDIVLVIDVSGSMSIQDYSDSWDSRLDIAKQAANTVIDTLSPKDRVGIVSFSTSAHAYSGNDEISNCYQTRLAHAGTLQKWLLMDYVDSLTAQGQTYYSRGLNKAFDMFRNSEADVSDTDRKKLILFLTDGDPTGADISHIIPTIEAAESDLNNSVSILAFGIGGISSSGQSILNSMVSTSQTEPGTVTIITNTRQLRRDLASYYNFFATPEFYDPIIALPYFDFFGLGLITTVSLPVYVGGNFVGVVGIDISLADLYAEVDYFQQDAQTYAFVVDHDGVVISHPLIPQPSNVDSVPVHTSIYVLEQAEDMAPHLVDMLSGGAGSSGVLNTVTLAKGNAVTEGVKQVQFNATFYWLQVNETSLAVGLILGTANRNRQPALTEIPPDIPFTYHEYTLMPTPPPTCQHFMREAIVDDSVVKFGPQAFLEPYEYIDAEETAARVSAYQDILTGALNNDLFRDGVKESISLSGRVHAQWFESVAASTATYAVWRYIAFSNGVLRLTPGTNLQKQYDPVLRDWYKRSVAYAGKNVVSAPYLDAFGAGFVITLSHTLSAPSSGTNVTNHNATSQSLENVIGVMAVDFTVNYFYYIMKQSFTQCVESQYSCMIIDSAGYIVVHPDFITVAGSESPLVENVHITVKEEVIASSLISLGYMMKKSCVDVYNITRQYHYEVTASSTVTNELPFYEMTHVPGTNIFIIIHEFNVGTPDCECADESALYPPKCEGDYGAAVCPCPCYRVAEYDFCSRDYATTDTSLGWAICPPEAPTPDVIMEMGIADDMTTLEQCYNFNCREQETEDECLILPQCNYCVLDTDGSVLENPFCEVASYCYFGQINFMSPYDYFTEFHEDEIKWIFTAVLGAVGGLIGLVFILGTGILLCKCCCKKDTQRTNRADGRNMAEETRRRLNEMPRKSVAMLSSVMTPGPEGTVLRPTESEVRGGCLHLKYCCPADQYIRLTDNSRIIPGWKSLTCRASNIKRVEDYDSRTIFLARDSRETGLISWRFDCAGLGVCIHRAEIEARSSTFEFGDVTWDVICNDQPHSQLPPGGARATIAVTSATNLTLVATLKGNLGHDPSKQTQLFRQSMPDFNNYPLDIKLLLRHLAATAVQSYAAPAPHGYRAPAPPYPVTGAPHPSSYPPQQPQVPPPGYGPAQSPRQIPLQAMPQPYS